MLLYNFFLAVYAKLVAFVGLWKPKAKQWTDGRKDIFRRMAECISPSDRVVWIHVASLGEFEQGRPVIEEIRKNHPHYKVLLTFFSPSGYEIRKNYDGADYIFYLPVDTPSNVRRFLEIAHPEIAVFVKYEFWLNYLSHLGYLPQELHLLQVVRQPLASGVGELRTDFRTERGVASAAPRHRLRQCHHCGRHPF